MLHSFGLGDTESSLFIILLKEGAFTAKELAQRLDISSTKIYSYLNTLEEKRIIIKTKTRPTTYLAMSPKSAVSNLLEAKQEEVKRIESEAREIEHSLNEIASIKTIGTNFLNFNTGNNLRQKTHAAMLDAKDSLDIIINLTKRHFGELLEHTIDFFGLVDQVSKSNGKVRVILGLEDQNNQQKLADTIHRIEEFDSNLQIRIRDPVHTFFYIIDKSKVLLKIIDPVTGNFDFASITIWDPKLASTFIEKFNILWENSAEFTLS